MRQELDTQTILKALGGDAVGGGAGARAAFQRLYRHYDVRLRASVARAAISMNYRHRIDELHQDVWRRLLDNDRRLLRYFDPRRGPFGPFLTRLAYQQALAAVALDRRQSGPARDGGVAPDEAVDHGSSQFVAQIIQSDFYAKLMARVEAELERGDRLILDHVYLGGRTCRAVALEYGINENTLYKRHQRLKQRLRAWAEELEQQGGGPPTVRPPLALVVALIVAGLASLALEQPALATPEFVSPAGLGPR